MQKTAHAKRRLSLALAVACAGAALPRHVLAAVVTLNNGDKQNYTPVADTGTAGFSARFFNGAAGNSNATSTRDYTGTPVLSRTEPVGTSPTPLNQTYNGSTNRPTGVGTVNGSSLENFGAQYLGKISVPVGGGNYAFQLNSDDGTRLFINNRLILNNEGGQGGSANISRTISLAAGLHDVRIDYTQGTGGSIVRLTTPAALAGGVSTFGGANAYTADLTQADDIVLADNAAAGLNLNGNQFTSLGFTSLSAGASSTLSVTGQDGKLARFGTTTLGTSGNFTVNAGPDVALGAVAINGNTTGSIVKQGTGYLFLDATGAASGLTATNTLDVRGGAAVLVGSSTTGQTNNPIGAAGIRLDGGNLLLDTKNGNVTFDNAVDVVQNATIEVVPLNVSVTLGSASRGVSIAAGQTLTVSGTVNSQDLNLNAATLTLPGKVTGTGGLTKTDNASFGGTAGRRSTLVLSNNTNDFTGPTSLLSGELRLDASNALGATSLFSMAAGTTLNLNAADSYKSTYNAFTVPVGASLRIGNSTALSNTATLTTDATLGNGATLRLGAAASGTGTIIRAGTGRLGVRLEAATALTGTQFTVASIQSGDLVDLAADTVTNVQNINPGVVFRHLGDSNRTQNTNLTLNRDPAFAAHESGVLTLTSNNADRTYTSNGVITIGANGGMIAGNNSGTTLRTFNIASDVNIGANTLTIGSTTAITGQTKAGTVAIGGTNVNLTGTGAINVVAGTFVASGGTGATYDAGSINLASGTTFRSDTGAIINARIVSNGGNIRFTATTTPRAASIEGSGTLFIGSATDNTNSPLEVGSNNLSTTFSGVVRNTDSGGTGRTGSLTKVGDGVLTLTGVNLYTGGTNVRGGTLLANTAATGTNSATGTGAVVVGGFTTGAGPFVQNDAVGTLGGTGRIAGAVTVNQGGIIAPGPLVVAGTVGTLTVASPVTLGAAGTGLNAVPTLAVKLTASDNTSLTDDSDVLALTGVGAAGVLNISSPDALNLLPLTAITTPTTYTIATFASLDPALPTFENVLINGVVAQSLDSNLANYALVTFNSNNIQVTVNNLAAIPEPATAGLLGLAAGGLLARRRRALR